MSERSEELRRRLEAKERMSVTPPTNRERVSLSRREKRDAMLNELVPDRVCPDCNRVFLKSKSWVLSVTPPTCRSCYNSMNQNKWKSNNEVEPNAETPSATPEA